MEDVEVPSGNEFNSDGSIEEQKEKEQKGRSNGEAGNPSRNTGPGQKDRPTGKRGQTKAETATRAKQQAENAKKERRRQQKYEAHIRGNSTAALVNFDKSLPSGAAARRDHLNTLGRTEIPQAESSTVTAMLKPIRRRQRGMSAAEAEAAALAEGSMLVASRSEPVTEKVTRGSMATLAPGQWLNDEIINFVGRVLIAPRRSNTNSKAHVYSSYFMNRLQRGAQKATSTVSTRSETTTKEYPAAWWT